MEIRIPTPALKLMMALDTSADYSDFSQRMVLSTDPLRIPGPHVGEFRMVRAFSLCTTDGNTAARVRFYLDGDAPVEFEPLEIGLSSAVSKIKAPWVAFDSEKQTMSYFDKGVFLTAQTPVLDRGAECRLEKCRRTFFAGPFDVRTDMPPAVAVSFWKVFDLKKHGFFAMVRKENTYRFNEVRFKRSGDKDWAPLYYEFPIVTREQSDGLIGGACGVDAIKVDGMTAVPDVPTSLRYSGCGSKADWDWYFGE